MNNYSIKISLSPTDVREFSLAIGYYVIGRLDSCSIHIPDSRRNISRIHSTLVIAEENRTTYPLLCDGSLVNKTPSANGTWVNDKKITRVILQHQAVITFGQGIVFPNITFYIDSFDIEGDTIGHEKNF